MTISKKTRLAATLATAVLAAGFTGSALADRDHGRNWDRDRHERNWRDERRDDRRRYDDRRRWDDRRAYERRYAPRYDYRYRAPAPRGWYPGWREPYGRGYRYWNDNYYYYVPAQPGLELSFSLPLR